jgi:hypothetical protein
VGLSSVGDAKSGDHRVFCAAGEGEMQASGLMREERRNPPPLPTIVVDSRRVEHHPPCERRGRWPVRLLSPTSRVGSRLSNI